MVANNTDNLIENIRIWGFDKGITNKDNAKPQMLKSVEEMGELASSLLKDDAVGIKDGIGDVAVTLILLAETQGMRFQDCLEYAWNEIKDRKGKTENGVFKKEK
jgi:NTP pyrophosphatase (non-canonical NTP hydrolase)